MRSITHLIEGLTPDDDWYSDVTTSNLIVSTRMSLSSATRRQQNCYGLLAPNAVSVDKNCMRILKSARVTLEPQCSSHAEEMFKVLSDPAIYEYENAPPQSADWLRGHFEKLEPRKSPDSTEQWLNWVVRLPAGELIGYVQATVKHNGSAYIAYEFASAFWGRGLASEAVNVMVAELELYYQVRICLASLKAKNLRSLRLLERQGFLPGSAEQCAEFEVLQSDEVAMQRKLAIG